MSAIASTRPSSAPALSPRARLRGFAEAHRSATIVKDLLALTRWRDRERRMPTDLNDIVGYIVRQRRYALETAGIARAPRCSNEETLMSRRAARARWC